MLEARAVSAEMRLAVTAQGQQQVTTQFYEISQMSEFKTMFAIHINSKWAGHKLERGIQSIGRGTAGWIGTCGRAEVGAARHDKIRSIFNMSGCGCECVKVE